MRKSLLALACLLGVAVLTGANLITQDESLVSTVFTELKFESVKPADPKVVGCPASASPRPRSIISKS